MSDAEALAGLLAEDDRLRSFAALVLGAVTVDDIVEVTGIDRRRVVQSLERLVSGGLVERCILGPLVRINSYSHVEDSILFEGVDVGRHAQIRRAIIDKGVKVPPGMRIGYDLDAHRRANLTVTENGIVVIAKGDGLEHMAGPRSS